MPSRAPPTGPNAIPTAPDKNSPIAPPTGSCPKSPVNPVVIFVAPAPSNLLTGPVFIIFIPSTPPEMRLNMCSFTKLVTLEDINPSLLRLPVCVFSVPNSLSLRFLLLPIRAALIPISGPHEMGSTIFATNPARPPITSLCPFSPINSNVLEIFSLCSPFIPKASATDSALFTSQFLYLLRKDSSFFS